MKNKNTSVTPNTTSMRLALSINGIKFEIIDKKTKASMSYTVRPTDLQNVKTTFSEYSRWIEWWLPHINYYSNYTTEVIEKKLTEQEKNFSNKENKKEGKPIEYSIGENFAAFLEHSIHNKKVMADNGQSARWIEKEYAKKFGKKACKKLTFDPESSYCYVYTTDKKEAIRFELWAYETIIKPALDKVSGMNQKNKKK